MMRFRPRLIPVLLLKGRGLVKTTRFKDPRYIGDPINAVKIFNEKEADEICLLDILATTEGRDPDFELIAEIASETFMPLSYGGGVNKMETVEKLFACGVDKIVIGTAAIENPDFVRESVIRYGGQSICVSVDFRPSFFGGPTVYTRSGTQKQARKPLEYAQFLVDLGVGEILLHAIDRDGMMSGFDLPIIQDIAQHISIPVIACGGAGALDDVKAATLAGASAVAAGSMFVFHGKHRAVLINYPNSKTLEALF